MTELKKAKGIGHLVGMTLDVFDLELTKKFWKATLGTNIKNESETLVVFEPQPGCTGLSLQKVPENRSVKNRAHPDIKLADLDAGVEKLKELGASVVRELSWNGYRWMIMADPEGNEFCALQ